MTATRCHDANPYFLCSLPHTRALLCEEEFWRALNAHVLLDIFDSCDIKVDRITINSLQDNTFYASIVINNNGTLKEIDARPSDAIAIAIRTKAPIWVIEEVIADASIPVDRDADEQERQAFRSFVSNLRPDDLIRNGGYAS